MLGLEDKEKRERAEFVIKNLVLAVSAVWALLTGTAYLNKTLKGLELRNRALGIESNPTATTSITDYKVDFPPWGDKKDLCTITGAYRIRNSGKLNFHIDRVSFEIYRLPLVEEKDVGASGAASITMEARLAGARPIHRESVAIGKTVTVGEEHLTTFGYIVRRDPQALYTIRANAKGGLPTYEGGPRQTPQFGPTDLQEFADLRSICAVAATVP